MVVFMYGQRRLKARLGPAYGPLMGLSSGHYKLDLLKDLHRFTAERIICIDNTENQRRKE